jgi:polyisoprenoid-binding protein YceI
MDGPAAFQAAWRREGTISAQAPKRTRFVLDPSSCAVLVEARSNVGTVSFGTTQVNGVIEAVRTDDHIDTDTRPCAHLTIPLDALTSGNALYDAELQQRLAVQRYPVVTLELTEAEHLGASDYRASGRVTIHGMTSTLAGGVTLTFPEPDAVLVVGEQVVDIRDFDIELPSVLMLHIYPDVKVSVHLLARRQATAETEL